MGINFYLLLSEKEHNTIRTWQTEKKKNTGLLFYGLSSLQMSRPAIMVVDKKKPRMFRYRLEKEKNFYQ